MRRAYDYWQDRPDYYYPSGNNKYIHDRWIEKSFTFQLHLSCFCILLFIWKQESQQSSSLISFFNEYQYQPQTKSLSNIKWLHQQSDSRNSHQVQTRRTKEGRKERRKERGNKFTHSFLLPSFQPSINSFKPSNQPKTN